MTSLYVATASWKLRHDEPFTDEESEIRLLPAPADLDPDDYAPVIEMEALPGVIDEIDQGRLPVALVHKRDATSFDVTHLLLRMEPGAFQLLKPPSTDALRTNAPLRERLRRAHGENHLFLNNFECFYFDRKESDVPACVEYAIQEQVDPETLALALLDHLASRGFPDFQPAFADEIRLFNHCTTRQHVRSCVVANEWFDTRRKASWDTVISHAWARRPDGSWHLQPRAGALEGIAVPTLATVAAELRCESRASGHVYAVRFEHVVVVDTTYPQTQCRCSIRYVRSRGPADAAAIPDELSRLAAHWTQWAMTRGLPVQVCPPGTPHTFDLALGAIQ